MLTIIIPENLVRKSPKKGTKPRDLRIPPNIIPIPAVNSLRITKYQRNKGM